MNEPKLRFKADDGSQFPDWEECTINDIFKFFNGKAHENIICEDGEYIVVNSKFISTDGMVKKYTDKMIFPLKKNDIVMVMSDVPNGKAMSKCFLIDKDDKYTLNQRICCLRTKENSIFFINQISQNKYFLRFDDGIKQTNLRKNDVLSCPVFRPCLPEQQKIADFLSTIDTVIAKQKETVSAWEERKKGVMQKLFSQEVRFKADDGSEFPDWEEKPYLSLCNVLTDGDWIESKDQSDSGIRLIQTGNIGNGIFIDKGDKKKYISKETFDRLKCNEVFEGDILISRLPSPAGRACIVPKLNERMITAVDCTIVRTDKSIISHDYCAQFMQSSKHFYYVASMMAGGTRQRISRRNLEDELISVPCLAEQRKIADCLSSFDEVIEKQKATLSAWEELKKGLLQQMFV